MACVLPTPTRDRAPSTMQAIAVPNPPTTPRRVKVYELRNNDWFDRGTGYCTGHLVNVSPAGGGAIHGPPAGVADDARVQDEPHIQVKSEDESDRVLLSTKIIKDDGYQKQQGELACAPGRRGGLADVRRNPYCVDGACRHGYGTEFSGA